jgi:ADP-heptose:LPS heptosyltransferase
MSIKNARRILVYHTGSMGDNVVALPSFRLVRQACPEARITALTNVPYEPGRQTRKAVSLASVVEGMGLVDDFIEYPYFLRDPRVILKLRRQIRERRFEYLVYLFPVPAISRTTMALVRDSLFFLSCGIFRHVGVPFQRRDRNLDPLAGSELHRREGERYVGCLRRLGQPDLTEDRWWDLCLTEAEGREAEELLRGLESSPRFIAICVGTRADTNDWTDPNWSSLLRTMTSDYHHLGLVALGSSDESDRMARLLEQWSGPTLNLCGVTRGPRLAAAVIQRASLYLGHDSGPMHLAAAVNTPCVAIFSARNPPGEWFPRGPDHTVIYHKTECYGCRLTECTRHQKKCILSITVDEVYDAVKGQLAFVD